MPHRSESLIRGAAFIVAGELCFASMGVGIRFVSIELDNEMIVFARNLIALSLILPWLLRRGIGSVATGVPGCICCARSRASRRCIVSFLPSQKCPWPTRCC
jgi:drug/metabolite transporter (DMT)-like permease